MNELFRLELVEVLNKVSGMVGNDVLANCFGKEVLVSDMATWRHDGKAAQAPRSRKGRHAVQPRHKNRGSER